MQLAKRLLVRLDPNPPADSYPPELFNTKVNEIFAYIVQQPDAVSI